MSRKNRQKAGSAGSSTSRFYVVLGVIAVVGVIAVGYAVSSSAMGRSAASEPVEVEGLDDMARLVQMAQGVTIGDPDAPIKIVEFADYQCPGCGQFARAIKPRVDLAHVQTGDASFVFFDFPLVQIHPHAFLAARAARCAGDQEKYWEYHDALFANQATWAASSSPVRLFVDYAEGIALAPEEFESCLRSDRHADVVTANMRLGEELGVNGTPTVMISPAGAMARRLPSFDFETINQVVEELKQQGGSGG